MLDGYRELTGAERQHQLEIMFRVLRPKPQLGAGKKLPDASDEDARRLAEMVCQHLDMSDIKMMIGPGAGNHSVGTLRQR